MECRIAKIIKEMKGNPKGVRFNDLKHIISVNLARAVVVTVSTKLHGLEIHV
jgi:hypothetical protein